MSARDYTELYFVGNGSSFKDRLHEDTSKIVKENGNRYSYFIVKRTTTNGTIIYFEIFGTNNLEEVSKVLRNEHNYIEQIYEITHEEDGIHVHKMNKTDLT